MIFITLGSQKFQFNRLLKAVDELIAKGQITDEVFAQIGYSDHKPHNYKYKDFLDHEEFERTMQKAEIVITHGGTGAIVGAVKQGKKVIAVPRLREYGEHVDNHQVQIIQQFGKMEFIEPCYEMDDLQKVICKIKQKKYSNYVSNTNLYIDTLEKYINSL